MSGYEDGYASNRNAVEQYFCMVHQMAYTPRFLEADGKECPKCLKEKAAGKPK